MEVPHGYTRQIKANTLFKMRKVVWLKQSPRACFGRFTKVMTSLKYRQSHGNHTLFLKYFDLGE